MLTLNPMNSSFNKLLTFKTLITASMIIVFSINLLLMERVDALSDSRQLVLDAWNIQKIGRENTDHNDYDPFFEY